MFYSHEVLTNRKYGVATVWLVATLGNKSSLKKINRKQILDVDVVKACQTIVDPVAPMALRLQGSLLYGVSRVYMQQCGYVLSDAQQAQNQIRVLLRTEANAGLDPEAGRAKPEQLVLPDDPSFLPGFALPPPELLAELDLNFGPDQPHPGDSQTLTLFGSQQSPSSQASAVGGLVLPSSSSGVLGDFQVEGDNGPGSMGGRSGMLGADDMVLDLADPDFTFDADGELVDLPPRNVMSGTPGMVRSSAMLSDAGASVRVRREHEEGQQVGVQIPDDPMDLDLSIFRDDPPNDSTSPAVDNQYSNQPEVVKSTSSASAPMRQKKRTTRVLGTDMATEIHNKHLAAWNIEYLQNMKVAARTKVQARMTQQAKKNAEYYLWGSGLGGIGHGFLGAKGTNPFDRFIGDNLFQLFIGVSRKQMSGLKHDRDSGIDEATQQESRRVRQKTGEREEQIGRGAEDEEFFMLGGDDIELPREAVSALDDQQIFSAMPWNISASVRGSSVVPRSGRAGMIGSGRGSRLVSASPLLGRGQRLNVDVLKSLDSDAFAGEDFGLAEPSSDHPEPEPTPALQATARLHEALSAEDENFLAFVTDAITDKRNRARDLAGALSAAHVDEISFDQLLPPTVNTKMIACQGFLMILSLSTKGMLNVQQPHEFGHINLKLTQKAVTAQIVEISDDESWNKQEESSSDVSANQEGGVMGTYEEELLAGEGILEQEAGHFEEQFSAGHATHEENDHDPFYDD